MTREIELIRAAENANAFMKENDPDVCTSFELGFEAGARWADHHPVSEEVFCKNDLNYIQGLEDGKKLSPWISVEDRLPEEDYTNDGRRKYYSKLVLVRYAITYDDSPDKPRAYYDTDQYFYTDHTWLKHNKREGIVTETITHWMPIPELPTTK